VVLQIAINKYLAILLLIISSEFVQAMKFLILIFSLSYSAFSFAASKDYKCIITNAVVPNAKGELYEIGDSSVIGKEFTVDRGTGIMAGTLKNNQVNAPVIIDIGSTENSFKAVTTMRGSRTSNVHALTIQEFIKDNKKPFVYLHDATVFYGVCTHY
jgi:hypothetical protein